MQHPLLLLMQVQALIHSLAAALDSTPAGQQAEGAVAGAAASIAASLTYFEEHGEAHALCCHCTLAQASGFVVVTASLGCNHQYGPLQLSTVCHLCLRTGIAGYSAGVITAIAVAVAVAVAVSIPGDDYDPSNGWIEVQDVPPDYDQRIIQQVRHLADLAELVAGLMSELMLHQYEVDHNQPTCLPQYFLSRPVVVARRSLRVAWSAISWGSGLGVDYLRGASCALRTCTPIACLSSFTCRIGTTQRRNVVREQAACLPTAPCAHGSFDSTSSGLGQHL